MTTVSVAIPVIATLLATIPFGTGYSAAVARPAAGREREAAADCQTTEDSPQGRRPTSILVERTIIPAIQASTPREIESGRFRDRERESNVEAPR